MSDLETTMLEISYESKKFMRHGKRASLKTDAQGKTHGLGLLRMELEVPDEVLEATPA